MSVKTDKLTTRIIHIVTQLNQGKKLTVKELANEFRVSKRIIQKDLNDRLSQFLPIVKENNKYYLESFIIGRLEYKDIKNFAILSGIRKLYPSLDDNFLSDVLNNSINNSCLVKAGDYEDISNKKYEFELIKLAIVMKHQLSFTYNNKARILNPYKLVNQDNIWYLVGDEEGKLKNYSFTKISKLLKTEVSFKSNRDFLEIIDKNQVNWFSQKSINVILEIDSTVSEYFLRRDLFPNQTILKRTKKKLIMQTKISYDEEILKIVMYWIPYIKILEPEYLQEKLINGLNFYLES